MSTKGVDSRSADNIELHEIIPRPADSISNSNETGKESRRNSYNSVSKEADKNEPLTGRNFAEHEGKSNGYLILLNGRKASNCFFANCTQISLFSGEEEPLDENKDQKQDDLIHVEGKYYPIVL